MLNLPLIPGAPWSVKIAADARLTQTDYGDDAIYALSAAGGPLGLFSAYGGRCEGMLCDMLWRSPTLGLAYGVEEYVAPPVLRGYGPGYALLHLVPFEGIEARATYIAHSSHATVCMLDVCNATDAPVELTITSGLRIQFPEPLPFEPEPAAPLRLAVAGQQAAVYGAHVATTNLRLGLLWDEPGTFESDPFPDGRGWTIWRHREVTLAPGEERRLLWGLLTPREGNELLPLARTLLAKDWTAELACHEAASADIPIIETGNSDWDAAIACAYRLAARCYLSGSGDTARHLEVPAHGGRAPDIHNSGSGYPPLPYSSFVFTRIPERGYPRDGDPENHSWQWNGQVATEAYVNVPEVVPFAPGLAKAVLRNYLHIQRDDGFIDWKPGLAGQRAGWDSIPLLAPITRMIYDYTGDLDFLREVYPGLLRHLDRWFAPENDRDGDGFPEWLHTIQSAFDDNPTFVPFRPWAQGADVSKAESPDLGAYLYREHMELMGIARLIVRKQKAEGGRQLVEDDVTSIPCLETDITRLNERAEQLRTQIESLWNEERAIYNYRDRDTHLTHSGGMICELTGVGNTVRRWQGDKVTEQTADQPQPLTLSLPHLITNARRVVVRVEGAESPDIKIVLRCTDQSGMQRVEEFDREAFGWWGPAPYVVSATTDGLAVHVDEVQVEGMESRYRVQVSFVDYTREDQTLLLPLWAHIPDAARAEALVRRTLTDPQRFWRPFGIPNCSAEDPAYNSGNRDGSGGVWMMWNTMLGEGLCDYGYFAEAWELFGRMLAAQVVNLSEEQSFREAYDSDTGEGLGDRDYLWGTVPLHLLTRLHGVIVVSPHQVRLLPADLCGHRVTVKHRGVTVTRDDARTTITWGDGREEEVEAEHTQIREVAHEGRHPD